MRKYYVYIMTGWNNKVLYIGVTNDIVRRTFEHKNELVKGFTKRYHLHKLVYFEETTSVKAAIAREKQLKGWLRKRKDELVETVNPAWRDLSEDWGLDF